jgi:hypothetical protein
MNTTNLISSSTSTNQEYNNSTNNSNINKEKNDAFESLISSKKTSTTTTTSTTPAINEKEAIVYKSSTQSLYEDIISLLKTGFTVGELKAFEDKLKEILKMKNDKESGKKITLKDIESALERLKMEILEAKKSRMGEVVKKASDNTISTNTNSDFETTIGNITNMLQEIKNSSKNTNTNDKDEENNEAYDKLKLILKMS